MNFNGSEHLDSKSMQSIKYEHVLKDLIKHNNGAEPAAPHPKNISESLKSQVPWPDTQLSHGRSASFPPLATQHTLFYPQLPEGFHPDLHSWSTLSWGVRLLTGPFPLLCPPPTFSQNTAAPVLTGARSARLPLRQHCNTCFHCLAFYPARMPLGAGHSFIHPAPQGLEWDLTCGVNPKQNEIWNTAAKNFGNKIEDFLLIP